MATEVTYTLPTDQFPLGNVFEEFPEATVKLERVIPSGGMVVPYFWVRGAKGNEIKEAFIGQEGLKTIQIIDSVDDQHLLRAEWTQEHSGILHALTETQVVLVNGIGTNEQWTFELRGDERSDIGSFHELCQELDIQPTMKEIHALTPVKSDTEEALTETQQVALELAFDRGYYKTPREVTLEELSHELDITQQAVASRLRRGINQILGETLPQLEAPNE